MADRRPVRVVAVALVLGPAAALAGCGNAHEAAVEDAASAFYTAIADRDGEAACDLLAPATRSELEQSSGKSCSQAIVEEQLPEVSEPIGVDVFNTAGEVRFDSETTFLGQFDGDWMVVAAGCVPEPPRPYDCKLSGG